MRRPTILLVSLVCLAALLIIFFGARRLILGPPAELVVGMTVRGVDGASLPETTLVVNAVSLARPSGNWVRL
ncbi:hypothetical protein GVX82_03385, partial [Patescibacteria group bacterium]|nr:hypothetical protein [Patescibacteria group bacterium]